MSSSATNPLLPAFIFPSSHALAGSNAEHYGRFPRPPLPDTSPDPKLDNAAIYVHPLVRKSYTKLSDKSLEMCTESLGSETGSDAMGETMLGPSTRIRQKVTKLATRGRLEYNYRPFPPPLTSIGDSVSLECCRENGRLVVNAVIGTETSDSLFQAERVDGRLRLRIKKGAREEDEVDETNGEVEEGEETERSVFCGEDFDGNMENVEGRIGIDEKFSGIGEICGILRNAGLLPDLFPTFSNLY